MAVERLDPADVSTWLTRVRTPEHAAAIAAAWRDFPDLPPDASLQDRTARGRERIAAMRDGAILVNTARGAVVDENAMMDALGSGKLAHAGLDVFAVEPLPPNHPLTKLPNVTLSAHSAFRTPEASDNLIEAALEHCRRIQRENRK